MGVVLSGGVAQGEKDFGRGTLVVVVWHWGEEKRERCAGTRGGGTLDVGRGRTRRWGLHAGGVGRCAVGIAGRCAVGDAGNCAGERGDGNVVKRGECAWGRRERHAVYLGARGVWWVFLPAGAVAEARHVNA